MPFKYTHYVYFYKGCIIFAYKMYAIHTRKNRNKIFFSTLDDQVMADNPVRLINAFIKIFTPRTNCNYCRSKQTFKTGFWRSKNECLFDRNYYKKIA